MFSRSAYQHFPEKAWLMCLKMASIKWKMPSILYYYLHTRSPTVHWEDNKVCISVVEAKIVTLRVKHIGITVCSLKERYEKWSFYPQK